jgi:TetR/AcrR family transcriptional repressor of nem operon
VNTASELTTHGEEVNCIVRNGLRELEAFFRRSVEVAQARKQIPATLDPEATAKGLLAMIAAIRVLGRGMFDESSLKTIAAQAQRCCADRAQYALSAVLGRVGACLDSLV